MGMFSDFIFGTSGNAMQDAQNRNAAIGSQYQGAISQALAPYSALSDVGGALGAQTALTGGLMAYDPRGYKVQAETMDTGDALGGVSRFLDPSIGEQVETATEAAEASHAGQGGLFSGAAGRSIAEDARDIAERGWGAAYDRANQAQQQANAARMQQQQLRQSAGQYNMGADMAGLQAKGQALGAYMDPINAIAQGQMDLAGTRFGADAGASNMAMQAQAADRGYFGDLLGFGAKVFGG
jgi:hypothetical protein